MGGQESTRIVWNIYQINTDAVVFVLDFHIDEFFEDSKAEFHKLLKNSNLKNAIILIFANKQDLQEAKPIKQIFEDYELNSIKNHM